MRRSLVSFFHGYKHREDPDEMARQVARGRTGKPTMQVRRLLPAARR